MKNRKKGIRGVAVLMSGTMLVTSVTPAFAANNTTGSDKKEEVIYINLKNTGDVKDIYAVNIFGKGDVTDYGNYDSVQMLNTTDKITQKNDQITLKASADRTYYEGKMKDTEIPWKISLTYYMDGAEYSPEELAGKSGKLEIHFSVSENPDCKGSFFDNYALQAAFTLDTEKCENIVADNATMANVGSDKQISYTILPGEGIDASITADVTDFEMDAVAINGVSLALDVDVDDEELMDQVNDLMDAIDQLDDGAGEVQDGTGDLKNAAEGDLSSGVKDLVKGADALQDGAGTLKDGSSQLQDGTKSLSDGASSLSDGMNSLNQGIQSVQDGLDALNAQSSQLTGGSAEVKAALVQIQQSLNGISVSTDQLNELVEGSASVKTGIQGVSDGLSQLQSNVSYQAYKEAMNANGLNIDTLQAGNQQMIATLGQQIAQLQAAGQDTSQLESMVTLLQGNSAAISGMDAYLTQINGSIAQLAAGAETLNDSYTQIDAGINELVATTSEMLVQMSALRDAINTLVAEYSKLDQGTKDYTDGVAQIVAGYSQVADGSEAVLSGSKDLKNGSSELYVKTGDLLNGIVSFYDATGSLKDGTGQLDAGVADLLTGIASLYDGTGELKDGTGELRDETDGMDSEISDKIDDMISSITGDSSEVTSFVSEKNTDVDSVQFVIQTEAIKKPEKKEKTESKVQKTTFWEKLTALFKKDK